MDIESVNESTVGLFDNFLFRDTLHSEIPMMKRFPSVRRVSVVHNLPNPAFFYPVLRESLEPCKDFSESHCGL